MIKPTRLRFNCYDLKASLRIYAIVNALIRRRFAGDSDERETVRQLVQLVAVTNERV